MTSACPYCRCVFEPDEEVLTCEACATPHHADCYAENGGCTVFGCAKAPADEPKLSISSADLNQARPVTATAPPPPNPAMTTSVPPPPRPAGALPRVRVSDPAPVRELSFAGYSPAAAVPSRRTLAGAAAPAMCCWESFSAPLECITSTRAIPSAPWVSCY